MFILIDKIRIPLFLLVLTLLFYYRIIINPTEMIYPASDVRIYSVWKSFFAENVKNYHELPLWNPYLFSGTPFVGDAQTTMFYPTSILFLLFPVPLVFGWIFILDTFFIGFFTYLYARIIRLDVASALVSACSFMFSGTLLAKLFPGHIFILDAIVYFPLQLFLVEKYLLTKNYFFIVLSGIILGLMLLSGNIQIIYYSMLFISFYTIFRLFIPFQIKKLGTYVSSFLLYFSIMSIIGILLAAIQLLPSFEFSALSNRASGMSYEFATSFSMHPYQIISAFFPHFFGVPFPGNFWGKGNFWETCMYTGIVPLFFACIGLLFVRKRIVLFYALSTIIAIFLSFGRYSPVYYISHWYIPGFDLFRVPSRFLFIYAFSISILAGFGASYVLRMYKTADKKFIYFIFPLLLVCVTVSMLGLYLLTRNNGIELYRTYILRNKYALDMDLFMLYSYFLRDLIYFIGFIFIFICILGGYLRHILSINLTRILLLLLILVDLWSFSLNFYTTIDPKKQLFQPSIPEYIQRKPGLYRVFDFSGITTDVLARQNIQVITGYSPIYIKSYQDFLWQIGKHEKERGESFFQIYSIDHLQVLQLLNVQYVYSRKPLVDDALSKIQDNTYYLYRLNNTYPRAMIVPNAQVYDSKTILQKLKNQNINFRQIVLLDTTLYPLENKRGENNVTILHYSPNEIKLTSHNQTPGYLVLSEIYYPGWKAYINGNEVPILKANYTFRSIYIGKGNSTVVFRYEPETYKLGLIISSIALSFLGVFLLISIKTKLAYLFKR